MLLHQQRGGCGYFIWPNGGQITNKIAEQILGRGDVQPTTTACFPAIRKAGGWVIGARVVKSQREGRRMPA